jgi:hypothetical protein
MHCPKRAEADGAHHPQPPRAPVGLLHAVQLSRLPNAPHGASHPVVVAAGAGAAAGAAAGPGAAFEATSVPTA